MVTLIFHLVLCLLQSTETAGILFVPRLSRRLVCIFVIGVLRRTPSRAEDLVDDLLVVA